MWCKWPVSFLTLKTPFSFVLQEICHVPWANLRPKASRHPVDLFSSSVLPWNAWSDLLVVCVLYSLYRTAITPGHKVCGIFLFYWWRTRICKTPRTQIVTQWSMTRDGNLLNSQITPPDFTFLLEREGGLNDSSSRKKTLFLPSRIFRISSGIWQQRVFCEVASPPQFVPTVLGID